MEEPNTSLALDIEELSAFPGGALVRIVGEIDMSTVPSVYSAFDTLVERNLTEVIIDATGVTFIDSTGIHALIDGKRRIREIRSRIVLVPSLQVCRVLELTFPEPLFAARVETVEEAFAILADGH